MRSLRRSPTGLPASLALAALLSVFAVAFSSPPVSAASPTLSILFPADNAVIGNGIPISVVFVASDFNLTEPGTGGPGPNVGHAEIYLDGALYAIASDGTVVLDVGSGIHDIRVRLVADDGTGLSPDVSQSITVTSTQGPAVGPPGIRITFPQNGSHRGPDTAVSYVLTNFAMVSPGAAPNVPNEGHVEVFLDGTLYQELTVYEPAHFSDVPDGDHVATLRLVDSADQRLAPDVFDTLAFHVTASTIIDVSQQVGLANLGLAVAVLVLLYYPVGRRRKT